MKPQGFAFWLVPLGLALLAEASPQDIPTPKPAVAIETIEFRRAAWGRNGLRLGYRNDSGRALTAAIRIRSYFIDSGSGIMWEAGYPALFPPREKGEMTLDYFVRPDHGRLRVELKVEDGAHRMLHNEEREFTFEAPYRGEYVLQPYRLAREGVGWEGRVLRPFRIRESEHFIFYCLPESEAEADLERIVPEREKIFRRLSRELRVELPTKIILFLYPDAELARKLTGHRGDGWAYGRTIVEVYGSRRKIDPHHELVHVLASRIGSPPALLAEGLATAWEKDFDNAGRYRADVESWCRGFLREQALIPLSELMTTTSLGEDLTRPRLAYPESACFVRYLLATYGWERVRRAYAELVNSPDSSAQRENAARFERIFAVSLKEAESAWKQELSRSRGRSVPEAILRQVIREETVPYRVARGRVLLTTGSAAEAVELLRSAVELDPGDLEAHFWLAQAHHVQKEYGRALEEYARVIRLGDRTRVMELAWSRVWSGQILDLMGRREDALAQYRLAEALGDTTQVQLEGRLTSSLEAARQGLSHPFQSPGE